MMLEHISKHSIGPTLLVCSLVTALDDAHELQAAGTSMPGPVLRHQKNRRDTLDA